MGPRRVRNLQRRDATRRLGFVTTNSITQVFSRRVIAKHLDAKDRLSLIFAIPNYPWVDEKDGAAVRIAMTIAAPGKLAGQHLTVTDERGAPDHILRLSQRPRSRGNAARSLSICSA